MARLLVLVGALAIVLAACSNDAPAPASGGPEASAETLDFTADRLGGGTIRGADLAGAPVAMWFWAPW